MTAASFENASALSHSVSLYPAAALPWWESMDPPAETDRMTSDLLNQADLRAQDVRTHPEKAAPVHTGMGCATVHRQSFTSSE